MKNYPPGVNDGMFAYPVKMPLKCPCCGRVWVGEEGDWCKKCKVESVPDAYERPLACPRSAQ